MEKGDGDELDILCLFSAVRVRRGKGILDSGVVLGGREVHLGWTNFLLHCNGALSLICQHLLTSHQREEWLALFGVDVGSPEDLMKAFSRTATNLKQLSARST